MKNNKTIIRKTAPKRTNMITDKKKIQTRPRRVTIITTKCQVWGQKF